jgi:hypothetical protein
MTKPTFASDPVAYLKEQGYWPVKKLSTGEWAGCTQMIYTVGLCVGLNEFSYETRFCYENYPDASAALLAWDGKGFPPGYWIKQKPEGTLNPLRKENA